MTGTDRIPDLTEATRIKTDVKTLVCVVGAIIGATIWCTVTYFDIQALKAQAVETQKVLDSLSRAVERINWTLNPTPAVTLVPHHGGTP